MTLNESNDNFDDAVAPNAADAVATPPSSTGVAKVGVPPQATMEVDAVCRDLQERVNALPPLRTQADTQTNPGSVASFDSAASLHRQFLEMEAALGIRVPRPTSTAPFAARSLVRQFVDSWRDAAGKWKRLRGEGKTSEDTETQNVKHVKREGGNETDIWQRLPDSSLAHPDDTPAWAVELGIALERCRGLLESPIYTAAAQHQVQSSSLRATLAVSSATEALPALPRMQPVSSAAVPPTPVAARDSSATLLCEAELICAREGTKTLLPMYTELHALRRMRAEREQVAAQTVVEQLEWEQRRLMDMLAECDAQLQMLDSNFVDSCQARLAPLETLQERIDALHKFHRQLEAHAAAMWPLASKDGATAPKYALVATELATRVPRPVGLVGDALSQCMAEERLAWERKWEALQTALSEQRKRNAELQACYIQANAQLHTTLERDNYVTKEVLNAVKAQHRADTEALVEQLGWTLINNTSDVLSLRHPGTSATLHVNPAYSTINGQACEDIAKTLAAYILQHGGATAKMVEPAAVSPASVSADETRGIVSEDHAGGNLGLPSPFPDQTSHCEGGAESIDEVMLQEAGQGAEETVLTVTDNEVTQAAPFSRSASAHDESPSALSSQRSPPPPETEVTPVAEPPMRATSVSIDREVTEVMPQLPISPEAAAESVGEGNYRSSAQEPCGGASAASDDTSRGGNGEDDLEAYMEEGNSVGRDEKDGERDAKDAEEDLADYSSVQAQGGSNNISTLSVSGNLPSSGSKGDDARAAPVQPAPYESFFSPSQLWENEDE
nr:hypothetical protein, conserved [Leishmania guyanensis]